MELTLKNKGELIHWLKEFDECVNWYEGKLTVRYGTPCPTDAQKIRKYGVPFDALETWLYCHQVPTYLKELQLSPDSFRNMKVLDIGCGPYPNLLAFEGCYRAGIDPLILNYQTMGFPLDRWSDSVTYCHCQAEEIPFPSKSFDAVISRNAIDHIDDFSRSALEVKRILRLNGVFRMNVHYHLKQTYEPIELNDEVFLNHYSWVPGLKKIQEFKTVNEHKVIWGNK